MKPAIATLGAGLLGLVLSAACGGDEFVVSDGGAGSAGAAGGGGQSGTSGQAGQAGQSGAAGSGAGAAGSTGGSAGSAGQAVVCQEGEVTCAGGCLPLESLKTDVNNCGGCQARCTAPRGLVPGCVKGECQLSCPEATTLCGVGCFDIQTDPNHCGSCGTQCTAPTDGKAECANGKCDFSCTGTTTKCGNSCVDTDSSSTNCGGCGNACVEGKVCDKGVCALSCSGDAILCDNGCVNLLTSSAHCGECNKACTPLLGGGQAECEAGDCKYTCPLGTNACGGSCVDLLADPQNCGGCGEACKNPDGSEGTCNDGVCELFCADGQVNCNGVCTDLSTDASHCGSCEESCAAGNSCLDGNCGVDCPEPNELCGDSCVDTQTTLQHCGGCGQACKMGSPSSANDKLDCLGGSCAAVCAGERIACERDGDIFCHLSSSPQYCGESCTACDPGQACNGEECVPLPCPLDQVSCGGECVDLRTDRNNCGACGKECADWQGCLKGSCQDSLSLGGKCALDKNLVLCDQDGAVYCTNRQTDSRNCGKCGFKCTNEQLCLGGQCTPLVLAAEDWECKPLGLTPCKLPGNKLVCVPGMACPD